MGPRPCEVDRSQSLPGASQEVLQYYLDAIAEQQGGADDSLDQPKRLV